MKLGYNVDSQIREKIKNDFYKKYSMYLSPTFYVNIFGESNSSKYLFIFFLIIILLILIIFIYLLYKNTSYYKKMILKISKIKNKK